ncbi:MAG: prephenate dehydrogenase/arogenate dehydrogenase family protein, partial [Proteobacteria bacterium]|nr:prephenate dehydrogenase/arogenate dehydrogenase family protein [Pseudomonadota bacterium]
MVEPMFEKVAFIGIGLIGSSMARRMAADGMAREFVACARSEETRNKALELGLVSQAFADPAAAVEGADLVVIATPIGSYASIAQIIAPALKPGAIITDVGSVKQAVVDAVTPYLPDMGAFVPGHPIAGTEQSGPDAGFPELFEGRWTILTPTAETDSAALQKITALWQGMGAMVDNMTPSHHDKVLAITSHLPHLIAYTIVGTATDLEDDLRQEVVKYSASGFRDFTRIAASDPVMWRDIFLNNREATLDVL